MTSDAHIWSSVPVVTVSIMPITIRQRLLQRSLRLAGFWPLYRSTLPCLRRKHLHFFTEAHPLRRVTLLALRSLLCLYSQTRIFVHFLGADDARSVIAGLVYTWLRDASGGSSAVGWVGRRARWLIVASWIWGLVSAGSRLIWLWHWEPVAVVVDWSRRVCYVCCRVSHAHRRFVVKGWLAKSVLLGDSWICCWVVWKVLNMKKWKMKVA